MAQNPHTSSFPHITILPSPDLFSASINTTYMIYINRTDTLWQNLNTNYAYLPFPLIREVLLQFCSKTSRKFLKLRPMRNLLACGIHQKYIFVHDKTHDQPRFAKKNIIYAKILK